MHVAHAQLCGVSHTLRIMHAPDGAQLCQLLVTLTSKGECAHQTLGCFLHAVQHPAEKERHRTESHWATHSRVQVKEITDLLLGSRAQ